MTYRAFSGEETRRELSPHRPRRPLGALVPRGARPSAATTCARSGSTGSGACGRSRRPPSTPPEGFDAVAYVSTSLARVPWRWEVEVLLDLPVDEAARRVPATLAELVDEDGATLLRMRVGSLDWMATSSPASAAASRSGGPDELRDERPRARRAARALRLGLRTSAASQPSSREIAAARSRSSGSAASTASLVEARARALERDDRLELAARRADRRRDRGQPGLALADRLRVAALAHRLDLGGERLRVGDRPRRVRAERSLGELAARRTRASPSRPRSRARSTAGRAATRAGSDASRERSRR